MPHRAVGQLNDAFRLMVASRPNQVKESPIAEEIKIFVLKQYIKTA
jgi:hypothetical protein